MTARNSFEFCVKIYSVRILIDKKGNTVNIVLKLHK